MKYLNKTILSLAAAAMMLSVTSCDDFLDVQSENTAKEEDLFSSYKGFRDALTGTYMLMADESAYGQNLTMTYPDALTNLWYCSSNSSEFPLLYQLTNHKYGEDAVKSAIASSYLGIFKTIAQANVVEKNSKENGGAITNAKLRATIEGEAVAIRAYCQLDVLRLFGQMPQGASKTVRLPYSFCTGVDEMPAYYDYKEYCDLLEKDINNALSLMKDSDPVCEYAYSNTTGSSSEDEFFCHRDMRLNYYAVMALKCRFLLYVGRTSEAHALALSLINAKDKSGNAIKPLSGPTDLSEQSGVKKAYYALPSECFFKLSKYDILKKANAVLFGYHKDEAEVQTSKHYVITEADFKQLYASLGTISASSNRYLYQWSDARNNTGNFKATIKYWYNETVKGGSAEAIDATEYATYNQQIIPMLRMSEIYLIAIETATSIDEANSLYVSYMAGCGIPSTVCPQFETMDDIKAEILNEYQREFAAEGQAFYSYKRTASKKTLFGKEEMTEDAYIIPLPDTEYDPALK